jgi:hypothetical protein
MKKHQVLLGAFFIALPFIVVTLLSGEVAPADSDTGDSELLRPGNTCLHQQTKADGTAIDCAVLREPQGG